jgi:hypothetical protein
MYEAQCLKDDTMAESIVGYLNARPYRRPLVVHVNGKFHSDYGLGTVSRVLARRPLTRTAVITMESMDLANRDAKKVQEVLGRAHYALIVQAEAKKPMPTAVKEPQSGAAESGQEPEPKLVGEAQPGEVPPDGKAALGIMPDYGAGEPGVTVGQAFEGRAANNGGIRDGDRIIKLGNDRVETIEDYMAVLDTLRPNQKVKVTVVRNGTEETFEITLGVSKR